MAVRHNITTTYELETGKGRGIEVMIEPVQVGNFNVKVRLNYYFGDDIENAETIHWISQSQ